MKHILSFIFLLITQQSIISQIKDSPCSHASIIHLQSELNPNFEEELEHTEIELQKIIKRLRASNTSGQRKASRYVIPVVMHVFHNGDDGKMDMEQALSGLEILNEDFNGLNDGWDSIDSEFDSIKGSLDITFCLATKDPEGNPTTGLIYYEDEDALYNRGDLFRHAWDNYKYLNIYFPKYTQGGPSNFTAYAYYPNTNSTNNNRDGIFYSSIRWGYGNHSELAIDDDWASVCSHEAGHWLNLRHTFEGACNSPGDLVDDTPRTRGSGIELEGCYNNDYSCNVRTNGENFMDYNHRCKKMFTQGQIERMEAALYLPSRINLWSQENLMETGCIDVSTSVYDKSVLDECLVYPNPASEYVLFKMKQGNYKLNLYNSNGQIYQRFYVQNPEKQIDLSAFNQGIYFYSIITEAGIRTGKFMVR